MKFCLILLITFSSYLQADSSRYKLQGDLAYADGFYLSSWQFYLKSFNTCSPQEKPILLIRLCSAAVKASKCKESLPLINSFLSSSEAKKLDTATRSEILLNKALLELEQEQWAASALSCSIILKYADKISDLLLQKTLNTAVYSLVSAQKLEEASTLIEKFHASFKDDAATQFQNARLKILLGQYINATAILNKYEDSKIALPHFLSFWAYQKAGNYDNAINVYTKRLSKFEEVNDPVFTEVLIKVAEGAYKAHPEVSIAILDKAYSSEEDLPKKEFILLKKAELFLSTSDPKAINVLQFFTKAFPNSERLSSVNLQLARLIKEDKEEELLKAESFITRALDKANGDQHIIYKSYLNRGLVRQKLKRFSDASEDMKKAAETALKLKLSPDKAAYPLYMAGTIEYYTGIMSSERQSFVKAAEYFKQLIPLNSSYSEKAYMMQAQSLRKAGQQLTAADILQKMNSKYTNNKEAIFLAGICYLEGKNTLEGIKMLRSFTDIAPEDARAPQAYVSSLKASIYDLNISSSSTESLKIISQFEGSYATQKTNINFAQAAPLMHHLKAILYWQQGSKTKAYQIWKKWLEEYKEHYLTAEVRLWLAYYHSLNPQPQFKVAAELYKTVLQAGKEFPLKGFTLLQYSKVRYELNEFTNAKELLKKSEEFYRTKEAEPESAENLAAVLFFSGEVNCRTGDYKVAAKYFTDAITLSSHNLTRQALKGRLGDCYFSMANKLKGSTEKLETHLELLNKAKAFYEEVYSYKESVPALKEQALYKLAKCYEALGLTAEKNHQNINLGKADQYLSILRDNFKKDIKTNNTRDPYFYCRASYDLARLHLSYNKDPKLLSAQSIYRELFKSRYPGTRDAKALANEISNVINLDYK